MFPILYLGARYWTRTPPVEPSQMDFYTGLAEIEADTYDEPPPKNRLEAFWQWMVSDQVEVPVSFNLFIDFFFFFLERCDEFGVAVL